MATKLLPPPLVSCQLLCSYLQDWPFPLTPNPARRSCHLNGCLSLLICSVEIELCVLSHSGTLERLHDLQTGTMPIFLILGGRSLTCQPNLPMAAISADNKGSSGNNLICKTIKGIRFPLAVRRYCCGSIRLTCKVSSSAENKPASHHR